ncbi:MAG: hypothetical protein AAGC85_16195 [Bacteroidota bacterium]
MGLILQLSTSCGMMPSFWIVPPKKLVAKKEIYVPERTIEETVLDRDSLLLTPFIFLDREMENYANVLLQDWHSGPKETPKEYLTPSNAKNIYTQLYDHLIHNQDTVSPDFLADLAIENRYKHLMIGYVSKVTYLDPLSHTPNGLTLKVEIWDMQELTKTWRITSIESAAIKRSRKKYEDLRPVQSPMDVTVPLYMEPLPHPSHRKLFKKSIHRILKQYLSEDIVLTFSENS